MPLSNVDRLSMLDQVREQSGDWREVLYELMEDAEAAVIRDVEAAQLAAPIQNPFDEVLANSNRATVAEPFTVVGRAYMDAAGNRFRPDGSLEQDSHGNRYREDGSSIFSPEAPGREMEDRWESAGTVDGEYRTMSYRSTL